MIELLTVRQTAEALQSTVGHVYRLIAQGYLTAINISPGSKRSSLRVTHNALVTLLETDNQKNEYKKTNKCRPIPKQTPTNISGIRKLRKRNSIRNGDAYLKSCPPNCDAENSVSIFSDRQSGI